MAKGFKHGAGGGGGGLNFKVICNPQPSTAKENTIWIDTDIPITSYIFSATEPEAPADGQDGPVWIITGISSTVEFNALKKNGIQVYPLSANQYIGGAWVDKTAKSWQGGEWVEWIPDLILLDANGFSDSFSKTGGTASTSTVTTTANSFTVNVNHSSNGAVKYTQGAFEQKYDLTNYNTLEFTVSVATFQSHDDSKGFMGVSPNSSDTTFAASTSFKSTGTYTVDISTLKDEHYIIAKGTYHTGGTVTFTVTEVKLKK